MSGGITFDSFPKLQVLHDKASIYVILNDKDYHIELGELKNLLFNSIPQFEIPPDVVRLDVLSAQLEAYLNERDAVNMIRALVDASPGNQLVGRVVEKEELEARVLELTVIQHLQQKLRSLEGNSYVTVAAISRMFEDFQPVLPEDLVRSATLVQVSNRVKAIEDLRPTETFASASTVNDISGRLMMLERKEMVSLQEMQEAIAQIEHPVIEGEFVTRTVFENLQRKVTSLEEKDTGYQTLFQELRSSIPELPTNLVLQPAMDDAKARLSVIERIGPVSETRVNELISNADLHRSAVSKSEFNTAMELKLSTPAAAVAGTILSYNQDGLVQTAIRNNNVYYVSKTSTASLEDGSFLYPFKTIQAAIDRAPSVSVVILSPGSYTENFNIAKDNILIQGYGCVDSILTQIVGKITVGGSVRPTTTRFRMKDVSLKNTAINQPCLVFDDNAGRHYFNNVTVEPFSGTTVPLVEFSGKQQNWTEFNTCNIGGEILLAGNPVNMPQIFFKQNSHYGTIINMQGEYDVELIQCQRLRKITHAAGRIRLRYVDGFVGIAGIGLESTSNTGQIDIGFTNFLTKLGEFAKINKTGTCPINIFQTHRDEVNDVITSP